MSVQVGLPVPKLLPITGTFVAPFSLYYLLLSGRVGQQRMKHKKSIENKSSETVSDEADPLLATVRSQSNFAENVPLALVIASAVELNGGNRKILTGALSALLLFRVAHVELGLMGKNYMGQGRRAGFLGTLGFITAMSGYAAYLVKAYWGF